MRDYIVLQNDNGDEFLPITTGDGVFVDDGKKRLTNKLKEMSQVITQLQDKITQLESGKTEIIINSTDFISIDGTYQKEVAHNLNSEKIYLTAIKQDTKEGYFIGWKIIDKKIFLS